MGMYPAAWVHRREKPGGLVAGLRRAKTEPLSGVCYPNGRTEARLRTVYGRQDGAAPPFGQSLAHPYKWQALRVQFLNALLARGEMVARQRF